MDTLDFNNVRFSDVLDEWVWGRIHEYVVMDKQVRNDLAAAHTFYNEHCLLPKAGHLSMRCAYPFWDWHGDPTRTSKDYDDYDDDYD